MAQEQTQVFSTEPFQGATPPSKAPAFSTEKFVAKTEDEWREDPEWIGYAKLLNAKLGTVDKFKAEAEYARSIQGTFGSAAPTMEERQAALAEAKANVTYTDDEYSRGLLYRVGNLKWNFKDLGLTALGFSDWSDEEQTALIRAMAIYDSMPTEARHVKRAFGSVVSDPTTYAGFGIFASVVSKLGLKSGAAKALNHAVNRTVAGGTLTAAGEGGIYTAADSIFNQAIQNNGDFSKVDKGQVAKDAAVGTAISGGLGYFLMKIFGGNSPKPNREDPIDEAQVLALDGPQDLDDAVARLEADGEIPYNPRAEDDILEGDVLPRDGDGTDLVPTNATKNPQDGDIDVETGRTDYKNPNEVGEDWSHMSDGVRTFNIDRIETIDDVKAFIEASSSQWQKKRLSQADGNPDGVETLQAANEKADQAAQDLLDETGMDIHDIIAKYRNDHTELQQIRYRAQALRKLNVELGERLLDYAERFNAGKLSDIEKQKYLETAGLFSQVMELTKLSSREFSRGLGNYRLIMRGDDTLMQGLQSGKANGDVDALTKTILGMTAAGRIKAKNLSKLTPKQRGKVLKQMKDQLKSSRFKSFMDELIKFRSSMMLSGPSTIEAAGISNLAKMWIEPFVEFVGNIGFGTAKKQARIRAWAQYAGTRRFFFSSWKQAAKAWKSGQHITDPFVSKIEDMPDRNLQNMSWLRRNVWERVVNQAHLALLFLDEGVKANRSRALVYADTVVEAARRNIDIKSPEFDTLMQQNLLAKFDGNGRIRDKEILREVRESTFTNELEGRFGKIFNHVSQLGGGAGRLIAVPFIRAPINILSEGLMYIPIPIAWTARQRNIMKNGSTIAKQKLKARKMLGAAAFGAVYYAAEEDLITGSGPSDYKLNKLWRESGYEPYSIRVGDQWISYAKIGPLGLYLGLIADINQIAKTDTNGMNVGDALIEYAGGIQHALTANVLNKAYFSSLNQLMDGIQDPDKNVDFWKNWVASFTPNLLAQMNNDENVREATSWGEKLQRRLPIISEKLGKQYDFYGRPIIKPAHDIPVFGYMYKNRKIVRDAVADEVYRLSSDLDRSILDKIPYSIGVSKVDFREVYDEGETESVYAKLNRYVGEVRDSRGRSLHEALEDMINSTSYQNEMDSDYLDITPPKAVRIQKVVNGFRNIAKQRLVKESPAYISTLREQQERKQSLF